MLDELLDKSVVGYTALGYRLRSHRKIETDLSGRVAVVTGATSGLGRQTASELARLGASVTLVGRNPEKTAAVVESIRRETGNSKLRAEIADLSEMEQIRALADRIEAPVHILVNNAGVLLPERSETREGFETSFATNLLGHFLLTNLLASKLERPARIVNVSSGGMYTQRIRVDDLQMKRARYDGAVAYARAKRGQVILTELWAEALHGRGVVVHSMHPGWADTPGVSDSLPRFYKLTKPLLRTPAQGADTIVWLCTSDAAGRSTGQFWHDRRPRPTHRFAKTRESPEERESLWARLTELSGWSGTLAGLAEGG
ncbi:MAG: SDR family NAD(P)-dependent oxidoreductase [Deltaproteobacteria bacterium]|nr:SDR family NAD(P)-dependent oxidoreductase [Deltaproteobacteria bacterium]NND27064.1 SDR family NAD(P)-dependent oxidoreductase [Myxococcales bacterium]MBT8466655.1 SDR family NAD(P)-dependent oxidoreductase [Deltaproteobacteria bacterium]MBT8481136.1 SDR family NAD(P)-dependent oxidoreductase [Deltaproteobacteria bacterium]NNK09192.1 SDR family NAD(P)-dependent oxidoreductase [Myxococcales bacterium]